MARSARDVGELLRRVIDGRGAPKAAKQLVAARGKAVVPTLEALAGRHGRFHRKTMKKVTNNLIEVLVDIAKKDYRPFAEALAHHVPCVNITVWALGHSRSRAAARQLRCLRDHEDAAIRAMADFHLDDGPPRGKGRGRKRPARPARKKAAKKKTAKKKA